ncbi:MAG: ATP-dependent Clp protease ATP-binding subunit ClpX [Bacilli bacterium]|nr:ATP-dependent Clp protease ATP-binding subunit ClpX [Bacilli bacterium]
MNNNNALEQFMCSFCGNNYSRPNVLLGLDNSIICENCIELYYDIINIGKEEEIEINDLTPIEIYQELNKFVIGQDKAKKMLSVAVVNHLKRVKHKLDVEKANVLLIGPTGSGKTLLAKNLAKILKLPFAIVDATVYTEAGYVGEDVENILLRLLQNANYDKGLAEKGIVFIDEIDKLARKGENVSITRDVSGEGVQNSLLKIIEGNVINIPPQGGRKHPYQEYITFDTTNVLFICAGAFDGLEKTKITKTIGFHKKDQVIEESICDNLIKYGIIPELLGRLPNVIQMDLLTEKELKEILLLPDNGIIAQYQKLLLVDNVKLKFDEEAIRRIAYMAYNTQGGARSLKRILEDIMIDIMFESSNNQENYDYIITKETIEDHLNYQKIKI